MKYNKAIKKESWLHAMTYLDLKSIMLFQRNKNKKTSKGYI